MAKEEEKNSACTSNSCLLLNKRILHLGLHFLEKKEERAEAATNQRNIMIEEE